jgi:hypothetical protein
MRYCLLVLISFLVFQLPLTGQHVLDDPETTSYLWHYYGQWDSLIYNRKALLNAVHGKKNDYFYLRYRLGEAAFRKGDFRQAAIDFERAVELNSADTFSLKFLEVAFTEAGRSQEALVQANRLKNLHAEKLSRYRLISRNFIYLESGIKFSNNTDQIGNLYYYHSGLNLQVLPRVALFNSLSLLKQTNYFGTVQQNIFYSRATVQFNNGWSVQPFFSYIDVTVGFPKYTRYFQNQVLGLTALKSIGHFDYSVQASYSNLNGTDQYQAVLATSWFPYGNNRLSFNGQLFMQQDDGENRLMGKAGIAFKILRNTWLSSDFYAGNTLNVIENAGYLVNNNLDLTRYRSTTTLNYSPSNKISLFLVYQYEGREEYYYKIKYRFNNIFVGLKLIPFD